MLGDQSHAGGRGGRRHDEDISEAVLLAGGDEVAGFFGRAIEDEQAIGSGFADLAAIAFDPKGEEQVIITIEHDGLIGPGASGADDVQQAVVSHAGFERALRGQLIRQTVGERIGEGDTDFEDVGAVLGEGEQDLFRRGGVGIARADVTDEGRTAFGFAAGKGLSDSIHAR